MDLDEVVKSALSLTVEERATLAEAERLWAEEAERRLHEYRAGRAATVSAEEVFEKAQQFLR